MRKTQLYMASILSALTLSACAEQVSLIDVNSSSQPMQTIGDNYPSMTLDAQTTEAQETDTQPVEETTEAQSAESQPTESQSQETEAQPTSSEAKTDDIQGETAVSQIVKPNTNINLRVGPGTDYDSAGLLEEGTEVTRIVKGDVWSKIQFNGKEYYVASQYLDVVSEGETVDPSQEVATKPQETSQSGQSSPTAAPGEVLDFSGYSFEQLSALSNDIIYFGYANERDDKNVPTGASYYKKLYGKYGGDYIADTSKNIIYLTMDEGYEAGYTPTILDVLKEKNVKAVFFVTKQFVTEHPELVTRMIEEGHIIGNHTCKHPAAGMPSLGLQGQYDDIMWLHNYVKEHWNYEMKLFRYPSGISSEQSLALVNSLGYNAVFWSYAHKDWIETEQPDPATALKNCLDQVHPGAIYLLHAVSKTNTENMAAFIDGCRAKGFEFGVYPANGF